MSTTDALLQEILTELRSQSSGGGASGGSSGGSSSSGIWEKAKAAVGKLGESASIAAAGLTQIGAAASQGGAGIQDVAAIASKSISGIVGTVFPKLSGAMSILTAGVTLAAQVIEANVKTQVELGKSGATFSGSLSQMRNAAAGAYLNLSEFAAMVKTNSDVLSTMGGNVQAGLNQFSAIQRTLLKPGTDTSRMLSNLGVSSAEAADLTASFMRSQGTMNKAQLQDSRAVASSVAKYAQELTLLSSLTGQSREAIQKELDAKNKEAQFQAYLAALSPEEAKKVQQGMRLAMAQGGQGAVEAFQAMTMGFPPMTEAAQLYTATQSQGVQALEEYNRRAKDASVTSDEAAKANRKTLAQQIAASKDNYESMKQVLQASSLQGGELAKSAAATTAIMTKFKDMSEEQIAVELEKMEKDQGATDKNGKAKETEASAAQNLQKSMMDLSNSILERMMPSLDFLLTTTIRLATAFANMVLPLLDIGMNYLNNVIVPYVKNFYTNKLLPYFEGITNDLKELDIKGMIQPFVKYWERIRDALSGVDWEGIFKSAEDALKRIWVSVKETFGPTFVKIGDILDKISSDLGPVFKDLGEIVKLVFTRIADFVTLLHKYVWPIVSPIVDGFLNAVMPFWEAIKTFITAIRQLLSGDFTGLLSSVKTIFSDLTTGLMEIATGMGNAVVKLLEFMGIKSAAPETPKRALGGPVIEGRPVLVGEKGPEIYVPDSPGQIIPNDKIASGSSSSSAGIMAGSSSNENMKGELQMLNSLTAQLLSTMKMNAEYTRRTYDATKELSGDLFA